MPLHGMLVVIKRSGEDGSAFPITTDSCIIGSEEGCDIKIDVRGIGHHHCKIAIEDGKGYLYHTAGDEDSMTLLNQEPLTEKTLLRHKDVITVGSRSFRFEIPEKPVGRTCKTPLSAARKRLSDEKKRGSWSRTPRFSPTGVATKKPSPMPKTESACKRHVEHEKRLSKVKYGSKLPLPASRLKPPTSISKLRQKLTGKKTGASLEQKSPPRSPLANHQQLTPEDSSPVPEQTPTRRGSSLSPRGSDTPAVDNKPGSRSQSLSPKASPSSDSLISLKGLGASTMEMTPKLRTSPRLKSSPEAQPTVSLSPFAPSGNQSPLVLAEEFWLLDVEETTVNPFLSKNRRSSCSVVPETPATLPRLKRQKTPKTAEKTLAESPPDLTPYPKASKYKSDSSLNEKVSTPVKPFRVLSRTSPRQKTRQAAALRSQDKRVVFSPKVFVTPIPRIGRKSVSDLELKTNADSPTEDFQMEEVWQSPQEGDVLKLAGLASTRKSRYGKNTTPPTEQNLIDWSFSSPMTLRSTNSPPEADVTQDSSETGGEDGVHPSSLTFEDSSFLNQESPSSSSGAGGKKGADLAKLFENGKTPSKRKSEGEAETERKRRKMVRRSLPPMAITTADALKGFRFSKDAGQEESPGPSKRRKASKSPELRGVRELLKIPKEPKSPSLQGIRKVVKTPKPKKSPKLGGVKDLVRTPKREGAPTSLFGVKETLKSPKKNKSPRLGGVKELFHQQKEKRRMPDDVNIAGPLARMFAEPKNKKKSPSSNLMGVARLLNPKKPKKRSLSPKVAGVPKLFREEGEKKENEGSSPTGMSRLFRAPKPAASPPLDGVADLFLSPPRAESAHKPLGKGRRGRPKQEQVQEEAGSLEPKRGRNRRHVHFDAAPQPELEAVQAPSPPKRRATRRDQEKEQAKLEEKAEQEKPKRGAKKKQPVEEEAAKKPKRGRPGKTTPVKASRAPKKTQEQPKEEEVLQQPAPQKPRRGRPGKTTEAPLETARPTTDKGAKKKQPPPKSPSPPPRRMTRASAKRRSTTGV